MAEASAEMGIEWFALPRIVLHTFLLTQSNHNCKLWYRRIKKIHHCSRIYTTVSPRKRTAEDFRASISQFKRVFVVTKHLIRKGKPAIGQAPNRSFPPANGIQPSSNTAETHGAVSGAPSSVSQSIIHASDDRSLTEDTRSAGDEASVNWSTIAVRGGPTECFFTMDNRTYNDQANCANRTLFQTMRVDKIVWIFCTMSRCCYTETSCILLLWKTQIVFLMWDRNRHVGH